jgi:hypothetical protein
MTIARPAIVLGTEIAVSLQPANDKSIYHRFQMASTCFPALQGILTEADRTENRFDGRLQRYYTGLLNLMRSRD